MNIVFLTLVYPFREMESNIYSDLMDEFAARGHSVTVFCPDEKRSLGKPGKYSRNGIAIVRVPTGKVTKAFLPIKALNMLLIERRYEKAVSLFGPPGIALLIYSTPPISFLRVVRTVKRSKVCKTYLLLKDIFPQNAVDLGLLKESCLFWFLLRTKEQELYRISDHIGCMSPANVEYIKSHNPSVASYKIHVCPNCIRPTPLDMRLGKDEALLKMLGIPAERFNLIYGGNLGKPQGVGFIIEALSAVSEDPETFTTIVGDGTEYCRLKAAIEARQLRWVKLIPAIPKECYLRLLASMDAGLVFLDARFSIPNFPSRVLDYLDAGLPVIACTDRVSDIRTEICESGAGLWCESGDAKAYSSIVTRMKLDVLGREAMAIKARELLRREYSVESVADSMLWRVDR